MAGLTLYTARNCTPKLVSQRSPARLQEQALHLPEPPANGETRRHICDRLARALQHLQKSPGFDR